MNLKLQRESRGPRRDDDAYAYARVGVKKSMISGTIPPEIGKLKHLTTLELDGNLLSGTIPPEITKMSHCRACSLTAARSVALSRPKSQT